jgi:hypothetical protein
LTGARASDEGRRSFDLQPIQDLMNLSARIKSLSAFTVVALTLAGCAAPAVQNSDVPLDGGHAVYTLPAAIFADANAQSLERRYAEALLSTSHWRKATLIDGVATGLDVRSSPAGLTVSYLHHANDRMFADYHSDFGIGISRQADNVILDVSCPAALRVAYSPGPMGLPWKALLPREEAATDLHYMCAAAVLTGSRTESGEVNVQYPDSSVYANFARKLQPAPEAWRESGRVTKEDLVKFKWFVVTDGQARRVVGISVYPYRSGSKVSYRWEHSVACRPNVPCQFDAGAQQHMQDLVTSIAND